MTSAIHASRRRRQMGGLVASCLLATVILAQPAHRAGHDAHAAGSPIRPSHGKLGKPPDVWVVMLDDATVADAKSMRPVWSFLVDRGVLFRRAYSSSATCCPARASLLTGQYPHNHGVLTNHRPDGGFSEFDDTPTIATWMDRRYETGWIGKYLNDYEHGDDRYVPPGWDYWRAPVDNVYNYRHRVLNANGSLLSTNGIHSDVHAGRLTRGFMRARARRAEPYFLVSSFLAPHGGGPREADDPARYVTPYVARRYRNTYSGPDPSRDPAFNERFIGDKRRSLQKVGRFGDDTKRAISDANAQRREALRSVTHQVMRTVGLLRRMHTLRDTMIVLVSDNGFMLGQHRLASGKRQPYEPASRAPLLVSGPKWRHGQVIDAPVGLHDVVPTILQAAHVPRRRWVSSVDGVELQRVVSEPSSIRRQLILLEAGDNAGGYRYRGVVGRRWKLVRFFRGDTPQVEMYDLRRDPNELRSLGRDPAFDRERESLISRLRALGDCRGATCR